MAAQLSADGLRIEGNCFPDPEPPVTTMRFTVRRDRITGLQEFRYDDATGTGNIALITMIWINNGAGIMVTDAFEDIAALWDAP